MGAKVTFNPITRIIEITEAPTLIDGEYQTLIDVQIDLYSDMKEDWLNNPSLRKYHPPIRVVGGDPLPGSKTLGDTYFLRSDWKIEPYGADQRLTVEGNLYSEDGTSPFIKPTGGSYAVQIERSVSNLVDSTIAQIDEIEYSSFNGGVSVKPSSSYSGTKYPVGTPSSPVNNLIDAKTIAQSRGFPKFYILEDMIIDSTGDYSEFIFEGQNINRTTMTVDANANVTGCEFNGAIIQGTLDGGSYINNCVVMDLNYVDGIIKNSLLKGTIVLSGSADAHILDCWSGVVGHEHPNHPYIDLGGSGSTLNVRNFSGGIALKNKTGSEDIAIDLISGWVHIESTVSNGHIDIRGVGSVLDDSTGSALVDMTELISSHIVQYSSYGGAVTIDTINGFAGTEFPIGTSQKPVNNCDDAMIISANTGLKKIYVIGSFQFQDHDMSGFSIEGRSPRQDSIDFTNITWNGGLFKNLTVNGVFAGGNSYITTENCLLNDLTDITLEAHNCYLQGTIRLNDSTSSNFHNCNDATPGSGIPTIDVNSCLSLGIWGYYGGIKILNMTLPTDMSVNLSTGRIILDNTCTNGSAIIRGVGFITDNSNGTSVDSTGMLYAEDLAKESTLVLRPTLSQIEASSILAKETTLALIKIKTDGLPNGIVKNSDLDNFEFVMIDSSNHVAPKTGLLITSQRSIDGSGFVPTINSPSEVGLGVYKINLAAADLNGDVITLLFTALGADTRILTLVTS